jgi:FHS family L-fucose permease-like MFS transporter
MAGPISQSISEQNHSIHQPENYRFALISLTSLFFIWGFITSLNDILIPYLKAMFELNFAQAMLIQFCFFGAYFIVSIPAGSLVKKIGYQRGIVIGLFLACLGCLLFYPAASFKIYPIFLAALFVLASGITILQVAANPFVSILGKPATASSRLTMTQAFNSLGTTVAPIWVGPIILASLAVTAAEKTSAVQIPYLILAASLMLMGAVFAYIKLPVIQTTEEQDSQDQANKSDNGSAWQYRHLVLGAVGIFVYVGAEVGIGSFIVNFLGMQEISAMEEAEASRYIGFYFGGAMVGRFIGAVVMQKIAAGKVLAFNAACAVVLLLIAMVTSGAIAMWAVLLIGLANSIMFPTIFTLAIAGLKQHTSQGSGILCLAIVGGAILPLLQGLLADQVGIQLAFIIPVFCFVFIAYYGLYGSRSVKQKEVHA